MNLSYRAIELLYQLSDAFPAVLLCPDGKAYARSATGVRAEAMTGAVVPRYIAFTDIIELLAAVALNGGVLAEIDFDMRGATVTGPRGSSSRVAADSRLLADLRGRASSKAPASGTPVHSFMFSKDAVQLWQAAGQAVGRGKSTVETVLIGDGSTASFIMRPREAEASKPAPKDPRGGFGSFRLAIGHCDSPFTVSFANSSLSLLPADSYEGKIVRRAKRLELMMKSLSRPITYGFPLAVSTVETSQKVGPDAMLSAKGRGAARAIVREYLGKNVAEDFLESWERLRDVNTTLMKFKTAWVRAYAENCANIRGAELRAREEDARQGTSKHVRRMWDVLGIAGNPRRSKIRATGLWYQQLSERDRDEIIPQLPATIDALYAIAGIPAPDLKRLLRASNINPESTTSAVRQALDKATPQDKLRNASDRGTLGRMPVPADNSFHRITVVCKTTDAVSRLVSFTRTSADYELIADSGASARGDRPTGLESA